MSLSKVVRFVRVFVPVVAIVLILGDFALEALWGDTATYTSILRSYGYHYPGFSVLLAAALGALWAHLCWTPGSEIAAIRRELFHRYNCYSVTERHLSDVCRVRVDLEEETLSFWTDWHETPRQAWLDAMAQTRKRVADYEQAFRTRRTHESDEQGRLSAADAKAGPGVDTEADAASGEIPG